MKGGVYRMLTTKILFNSCLLLSRGYLNISHFRSPCHLMPSDDIYRHLFGGKGFHPYFRTGQKRETYGNRNH